MALPLRMWLLPQAEVSNETTIDSIARSTIYRTTTTDNGGLLASADLNKGSTLAGTVQVKLARQANGDTILTAQYFAHEGHSLKDSGNVALTLELFVLGAGIPRGTAGGNWYQFDAKPDAADFTDGDLILVKTGDDQGAYVKESAETHVGG